MRGMDELIVVPPISTRQNQKRIESDASKLHEFIALLLRDSQWARRDRFSLRGFSPYRNHKDREKSSWIATNRVRLIAMASWGRKDLFLLHRLAVKFVLTLTFSYHLRSASNIRVSWRSRAARLLLNKSILGSTLRSFMRRLCLKYILELALKRVFKIVNKEARATRYNCTNSLAQYIFS